MLRRIAACMLLAGTFTIAANAQNIDQTRSRSSVAAYYNFAEVGDATIRVNVWGTVRFPGLYELPRGTTLNTLFSLAGGPQISERPRRNERTIVATLSRGGEGNVVVETIMENDVTTLDADPELMEGDVLTVEATIRQRFSWRDAFPIVAAIASVALAVERISSN